MEPQPWPEAEGPPHWNVVGVDPEIVDPKNGDYRTAPGSPAAGYGCRIFPAREAPPIGASRDGYAVSVPAARGDRTTVTVSGTIGADALWSADTIRVAGDVAVADSVTLTIAAGTLVEFQDFCDLTVLGRLLAVGTPDDPILFTTDEPGAYAADTTTTGCWAGIRFPWTSALNEESRLEHCVFECSKGLGDEPFGGALSFVGFSKALVRNCAFRSCLAGYGGAIFCSHHATPEIVGCVIEGNRALTAGSAIYNMYAYPEITSCTITSNQCLNMEPFDATGAVHNHISKPRTTGTIAYANRSSYFIPTQLLEAKGYYTTYCDIEDGHEGAGNIDADPLFVDRGEHPYALAPGSPCVNVGATDTTGHRLSAVDVAGLPRRFGGRVDIGAYESPGWTNVAEARVGRPVLRSCRPNPFRGETVVTLRTPRRSRSSVRVYDVAGRLVRTLHDAPLDPGEREISWDGTNEAGVRVSSGVYLLALESDDHALETAKLVLLR